MKTTIRITTVFLLSIILTFSLLSCSKTEIPEYYDEIPSDEQIKTEIVEVFKNNPLVEEVEYDEIKILQSNHYEFFNQYVVRFSVEIEDDVEEFEVVYKLQKVEINRNFC